MDTFINEDAKLAVKKGINWLDENHPNWASRIDLTQLDMAECRDCVIGQAVGDYTRVTRFASGGDYSNFEDYRIAAAWAIEHGFESPRVITHQQVTDDISKSYGYEDLDTLWSEEVRKRLG